MNSNELNFLHFAMRNNHVILESDVERIAKVKAITNHQFVSQVWNLVSANNSIIEKKIYLKGKYSLLKL